MKLVYVSSATQKMEKDELVKLLEKSKERNKRHNVTGMLLYADGNFFQVLEGAQADVERIYSSIEKDPRHSGLIVIAREEDDDRVFPEWSMGFRYLEKDEIEKLDGFSEFLQRQVEPEEFSRHADSILHLLYSFKQSNLR